MLKAALFLIAVAITTRHITDSAPKVTDEKTKVYRASLDGINFINNEFKFNPLAKHPGELVHQADTKGYFHFPPDYNVSWERVDQPGSELTFTIRDKSPRWRYSFTVRTDTEEFKAWFGTVKLSQWSEERDKTQLEAAQTTRLWRVTALPHPTRPLHCRFLVTRVNQLVNMTANFLFPNGTAEETYQSGSISADRRLKPIDRECGTFPIAPLFQSQFPKWDEPRLLEF